MSISAHQMMAWLSPAFPTGGFAYSHGLEFAVHEGQIEDANALCDWLTTLLTHGAGWNDAVLLAASYRGEDVAELASALSTSKERQEETMAQGAAFAKTVSNLLRVKIAPAPLPVVAGTAAKAASIPVQDFLPLYLHSFAANLIHAGIRLIPIGQTDGQQVLNDLFPVFDAVARKAATSQISDLGSTAMFADICAMKHETMTTRIFKS
ncbi:MAG: urease accessory protein UreF [Pseudomonadota bacterium]